MIPSAPRSITSDDSLGRLLGGRVCADEPGAACEPMIDLVLASKSPRRRALLTEAGIAHRAMHPGVDDGTLPQPAEGVTPEQWSMALAYYKAAAAATRLARDGSTGSSGGAGARPTVILGADTVVHHRGEFIGQPRDVEDAARIIQRLENDDHEVITGVALLDPATGRRDLFADIASVKVGAIGGERIGEYLASGQWHGKAGAYNLSERLESGWPIEYRGDPGTIMGLPVKKLVPRLASFVRA